ncbi:TPA: dTDP-6-deoxy-L-hexose 3-O-methyltransferase [Escherichia coli]|jgi:hypothetical protein|nr:dTDP-6-deoxy-L-hexose 3-O-methyltransferase [Escherichia coli]
MTTITKERIELFIKNPLDNGLTRGEQMELARIALASLEAEPVGAFHIAEQQVDGTSDYIKDGEWPIDNGIIEVYAAPPVPVVPAALPENDDEDGHDIDYLEPSEVYALGRTAGWNACRAAMLQSGNFRENKNSSTNNFREIAETSTNYPVIPSEVLSAILKVAKIRADFDDFDGDRRGIGDCLDEAEQELIVTINKYASQLAAEPIATNDVREQTAVPPVPVIQADVAQAIEKLKRKLVECNRYNYCADAVKGVEYACRVLALQNQNMSAPIRPEDIENAIEYIRSIAFHIDEDDYHGKHIAYFMRQALAWLEGHSCSAESQGKSDNSPLPRYQVIELTMLVKQLVSQLKKAKPDCKLPDRAMDYLLRNGLVSAEGVLR